PFAAPLGERTSADQGLTAWNWQAAEKMAVKATYHGRYPYGEWVYPTTAETPAQITLRQYSPFIPGDAQTSSLPVALQEIDLINPTDEIVEVSVLMSMPNFA